MSRFVPTLLIIILLTAVSSGSDWPQWRGPQRDGKSPETGIIQNLEQTPPRLLWTAEGMGQGYASVAVVDGKLYTTGNVANGQQVVCVDATTGDVLWSSSVTERVPRHSRPGSRCTPSIDGDRVYVITSGGTIVCLSTSGEPVWSKSFKEEWNGKMMSGWGYSESPLVDGEAVLCTPGGPGAMMVKLDKHTGQEQWRTNEPRRGGDQRGRDGAGYSSIVVSHGGGVKQYVQLTGRGLIGVRASDGKLLWQYNPIANRTANVPTPIPVDDYVFSATGYGTGACLIHLVAVGDGEVTADEVYFLDGGTLQNHHGGMIRDGDYVYLGHKHGQGYPTCVAWKTGEIVWGGDRNRGPGSGSAAITYIDGQIIYRYEDGTVALIAAAPDGYRLNGSFMPEFQQGKSWAHPVVVDGRLYLREQDKLMCYDFRR